jgi:hypothetical protein
MISDFAIFLLVVAAWGVFQLRALLGWLLLQIWLLTAALVYRRRVLDQIDTN